MRLTDKQIEHTLDQIEVQPIPDDNPVVAQLNQTFGDHTFFLDGDGLSIVETVELAEDGGEAATIVKLATWTDPTHTTLAAHEPQVTEVTVDVGPDE
jgi:hypothetical protein